MAEEKECGYWCDWILTDIIEINHKSIVRHAECLRCENTAIADAPIGEYHFEIDL